MLHEDPVHAVTCIRAQIQLNIPRCIVGSLTDHIHMYVDASFEEGGYSGLGGALCKTDGVLMSFFSEKINPEFIDRVENRRVRRMSFRRWKNLPCSSQCPLGVPPGTDSEWLFSQMVSVKLCGTVFSRRGHGMTRAAHC